MGVWNLKQSFEWGFRGVREGWSYFSKSNMMAVKYSCWRVRTPTPFFWSEHL